MIDNKKSGEFVEARFLLEAKRRQLSVSLPFGDNDPFDFIVTYGRKSSRVQVKSCFHEDNSNCNGLTRFKLTTSYGGSKLVYDRNQIDVIAGYIIPESVWYIVPVNALESKSLHLYPHRIGVGKFEVYKEKWDLLFPNGEEIPQMINFEKN